VALLPLPIAHGCSNERAHRLRLSVLLLRDRWRVCRTLEREATERRQQDDGDR
jgi:hypothetical protein